MCTSVHCVFHHGNQPANQQAVLGCIYSNCSCETSTGDTKIADLVMLFFYRLLVFLTIKKWRNAACLRAEQLRLHMARSSSPQFLPSESVSGLSA